MNCEEGAATVLVDKLHNALAGGGVSTSRGASRQGQAQRGGGGRILSPHEMASDASPAYSDRGEVGFVMGGSSPGLVTSQGGFDWEAYKREFGTVNGGPPAASPSPSPPPPQRPAQRQPPPRLLRQGVGVGGRRPGPSRGVSPAPPSSEPSPSYARGGHGGGRGTRGEDSYGGGDDPFRPTPSGYDAMGMGGGYGAGAEESLLDWGPDLPADTFGGAVGNAGYGGASTDYAARARTGGGGYDASGAMYAGIPNESYGDGYGGFEGMHAAEFGFAPPEPRPGYRPPVEDPEPSRRRPPAKKPTQNGFGSAVGAGADRGLMPSKPGAKKATPARRPSHSAGDHGVQSSGYGQTPGGGTRARTAGSGGKRVPLTRRPLPRAEKKLPPSLAKEDSNSSGKYVHHNGSNKEWVGLGPNVRGPAGGYSFIVNGERAETYSKPNDGPWQNALRSDIRQENLYTEGSAYDDGFYHGSALPDLGGYGAASLPAGASPGGRQTVSAGAGGGAAKLSYREIRGGIDYEPGRPETYQRVLGQDGTYWTQGSLGGTVDSEEQIRAREKREAIKEMDRQVRAENARRFEARSIHWSPYDRVGVVNADP